MEYSCHSWRLNVKQHAQHPNNFTKILEIIKDIVGDGITENGNYLKAIKKLFGDYNFSYWL